MGGILVKRTLTMICGKTIYLTSRDAIEAIKGLMKDNQDRNGTFKANRLPSRAYFCEECNGYHLYTENKKKALTYNAPNKTKEVDSTDTRVKENNDSLKTLIIHDIRKFKIK